MSVWSGLRALFGAPKPKKPAREGAQPNKSARAKHKTVLPPTERAALLKDALSAHRAGRTHMRDVLERELNELRAKVPNPNRDPENMQRLLSLHQADGALKRLMTHDLKRFLVLVGIRQLLGEGAKPPAAKRPAVNPPMVRR